MVGSLESSVPYLVQNVIIVMTFCLMIISSLLLGQMEPEVRFHSIGIISSDFGELNTPLPVAEDTSKTVLFTLKEGSEYRLKLTFSVLHNIVSGLAYTNTVWKGGVQGFQLESFYSFLYFCLWNLTDEEH